MPISKSQSLAVLKYRAKSYDRVSVDVKKGKRDAYKFTAAELGLSLRLLIQNGVEEYIRNHAGTEIVAPNEQPEKLSADERKLIEEFSRLSADAQKSLMKFLQAVNETKGGV